MGFTLDSPILNIEKIKLVLKNIPPIVFLDHQLTKMHNSLPLALFSLNNCIKLFEKKMYNETAFWFPVSISIAAMNYKNIGYQNRIFFSILLFGFLFITKNIMTNINQLITMMKIY